MNKNLIERYIWIVDTLTKYERLTREQLNNLWMRSRLSNGNPLAERTFFHYRRAIEDVFNLEIACNTRGEYYISDQGAGRGKGFTNWLLDSFAVGNALTDTSALSGRIEVEDVPSAREFLPVITEAMANNRQISFTYAGFNRSRAESDIIFSPYFLKRYKQRWYVLGEKVKAKSLKTYALDRIKAMKILDSHFEIPEGLDSSEVFGSIIGITSSKADAHTVRLRVSRTQAKYLRALPLHKSQTEELVADDYSIFSYRLKLNYELVHEIMAMGDGVKVLAPKELELMIINELRNALAQYQQES